MAAPKTPYCGGCCKPKAPSLKAPEINAPKIDLKGPKFEGPTVPKVGCCGGKLACMSCAGCGGACCKPKAPKLNAPNIDLKGPKFEGPTVPKVGCCGGLSMFSCGGCKGCGSCCKPSIKAPELNL